jgi:hypothetical protein
MSDGSVIAVASGIRLAIADYRLKQNYEMPASFGLSVRIA